MKNYSHAIVWLISWYQEYENFELCFISFVFFILFLFISLFFFLWRKIYGEDWYYILKQKKLSTLKNVYLYFPPFKALIKVWTPSFKFKIWLFTDRSYHRNSLLLVLLFDINDIIL